MLGLDAGHSAALILCGRGSAPASATARLVALAGWINQQQRDVIDYLREENRVLREQPGPRRLRFTDDQRMAAKPTHSVDALEEMRSSVTPVHGECQEVVTNLQFAMHRRSRQ